MVGSVVGEDVVKRVVRKLVAAVIEHSFDGGSSKEPHGLTQGQSCEQVTKTTTECVKSEALERVVVQSAVGIRDVEAVVARVEGHCWGQVQTWRVVD